MAAKVVDASAVAAFLFQEPEADAIERQLEGFDLFAPALLSFELANVCLTKIRKSPKQRETLLVGFTSFGDLDIETVDIDQGQVLDLAERTGLTAYDASYLWVAERFGIELVTLDKKLAQHAPRPARARR